MALIVLDASVLIGYLDAQDAHHSAAVALLQRHAQDRLTIPASVYAEILVGPYGRGQSAVAKIGRALADIPIRVEPIGPEIGRRAAELRARHRALRLPDAFVIATGEVLDADKVLTFDERWPKASRRVPVKVAKSGPEQ